MAMLVTSEKIDPVLLDAALSEVLQSQFFRSSGQCSSLLRYIVENTRLDRDECLRERIIGAAVFERPHDYDTGNDHIVRSRASEVRKRLAQFYQESSSANEVRIQIPSGSYRATFELLSRAEAPRREPRTHGEVLEAGAPSLDHAPPALDVSAPLDSPPPSMEEGPTASTGLWSIHRRWIVAIVLLLCLAFAGLWARKQIVGSQSAFDQFWSPMIKSPKPVLIYCGGAFVYKLSDSFLDEYRQKHHLKSTRREFFVDLRDGEPIDRADLIADEHFVPLGDLAGTARIVSTLARFNKAYDLRYGDDVAFTEFHASPVVLMGGLNNSWALRVTRNLRYVLQEDDRIVDQWHRERNWVHAADPDNLARDDYAVISRLNQSETGGFILSVAGIRMYGTRAAADLISDPVQLNRILADAPNQWQKKNLQIVIHTRTMNDIPVSTNIEAIHFW